MELRRRRLTTTSTSTVRVLPHETSILCAARDQSMSSSRGDAIGESAATASATAIVVDAKNCHPAALTCPPSRLLDESSTTKKLNLRLRPRFHLQHQPAHQRYQPPSLPPPRIHLQCILTILLPATTPGTDASFVFGYEFCITCSLGCLVLRQRLGRRPNAETFANPS